MAVVKTLEEDFNALSSERLSTGATVERLSKIETASCTKYEQRFLGYNRPGPNTIKVAPDIEDALRNRRQ